MKWFGDDHEKEEAKSRDEKFRCFGKQLETDEYTFFLTATIYFLLESERLKHRTAKEHVEKILGYSWTLFDMKGRWISCTVYKHIRIFHMLYSFELVQSDFELPNFLETLNRCKTRFKAQQTAQCICMH